MLIAKKNIFYILEIISLVFIFNIPLVAFSANTMSDDEQIYESIILARLEKIKQYPVHIYNKTIIKKNIEEFLPSLSFTRMPNELKYNKFLPINEVNFEFDIVSNSSIEIYWISKKIKKIEFISDSDVFPDFRNEYIFPSWYKFIEHYPNSDGFYSFTRVGYDRNKKLAVVYVEYSCGPTCGDGRLYLLEYIEKKWVVIYEELKKIS